MSVCDEDSLAGMEDSSRVSDCFTSESQIKKKWSLLTLEVTVTALNQYEISADKRPQR